MSATTRAIGLASACAPGVTVGNSPAALPPALTVVVGVGNAKPDAPMLASGDRLAPAVLPGASTTMEADAAGARVRLAALPVTVRLTAVRVVAMSGRLTSAWNNRCAEFAYTAPRSHADVPLPFAQPKVKVAIPALAVDCSWILASGTLPPSVQAPTSHSADCPRSLLWCRGATATHKLTDVLLAARNAARVAGWAEALAGGAVVVDVSVSVAVAGVGVAGGGVGVVGAGVGVGVGVVGVGAGVVGLGVVGVADGVAVALGDALTTCTGSQDSLVPGRVAAVAPLAMAATALPVAAESRALPAIKVIALRRPCAIRVPAHTDRYQCELAIYREIGTVTRVVGRETSCWMSFR